MAETWQRQFHILDGILLIAAMAVGIAPTRQTTILYVIEEKFVNKFFPDGARHPLEAGSMSDLGVYFFAPFSLALAIFYFWLPGMKRGRLLTKPGFVAVVTASMVMILRLTQFEIDIALDPPEQFGICRLIYFVTTCPPAAIAVISAWIMMCMVGRWRAERSWVDRAGRAIGAGRIGMALLDWFHCPI
jgi:hypothetical protein